MEEDVARPAGSAAGRRLILLGRQRGSSTALEPGSIYRISSWPATGQLHCFGDHLWDILPAGSREAVRIQTETGKNRRYF